MKKKLIMSLALTLALLTACGGGDKKTNKTDAADKQPEVTAEQKQDEKESEKETEKQEEKEKQTEKKEDEKEDKEAPDATPDPDAGPTELFFGSEVTALEGKWNLVQVFAEDEFKDAEPGALTMNNTLDLDPSELVDEANYIHNQVYNVTGDLTFTQEAVLKELEEDDLSGYRGSAAWSDFPQGEVVDEGEFYLQPGPATMRFKDVDAYGLFLDQLAGVSADIDTEERTLIIGMNNHGQLLLGYSEEHIERPGTEGEWEYLLIFDKAE